MDEELLMPLSETPYGKHVQMCSNAYVAKLDVKSKLVELSDGTPPQTNPSKPLTPNPKSSTS